MNDREKKIKMQDGEKYREGISRGERERGKERGSWGKGENREKRERKREYQSK